MSSHPQELLKAYKNTDYVVTSKGYEAVIRVGENNEEVAEWLKLNQANCAAFLTAFNPESKRLTDEENQLRHKALVSILKQNNTTFLDGYGKGRDDNWPAETSLLIAGDNPRAFNELATQYNQAAYVLIDSVGYAELIDKTAYT